MIFTVLGRDLTLALNTLRAFKQAINLSVSGNIVVIQASEPIIEEEPVNITNVLNSSGTKEVSVELDNSYNIIRDDTLVTITLSDQYVMFETTDFQCKFNSVSLQRMNIREMDTQKTYTHIRVDSLEAIARAESAIVSVAKSLKVNEPAVVVNKGYAYIVLSNFAYRIKTDLPNCVLSMKVIHAISDVVRRNGLAYIDIEVEEERGNYCVVRVGNERHIAFTFKHDTSILPQTIDGIISSCKEFSSISLISLADGIKIVQSTYRQIEADLAIGKNGICMSVKKGVTSSMHIGNTGNGEVLLLRTNIIAISALLKIMGTETFKVFNEGRYLYCRGRCEVLMSGLC